MEAVVSEASDVPIPTGFVHHWVNDDCMCAADAVYKWRQHTDLDAVTYSLVLARFYFSRSLFCGIDHSAEIRAWKGMLPSETKHLPDSEFHAVKGTFDRNEV